MPFRIIIVLIIAIAAAIIAVARPYLGLLFLVFLTFGQPQGDRPNVQALHIPMMMVISIGLGTLVRWGPMLPVFKAALKRLRLILVFFGFMVISAAVSFTALSGIRLNDFATVICLCLLTLGWVTSEKRMTGYILVLLASAAYLIQAGIRNPVHIVEDIGGQAFTRLNLEKSGDFGQTNYLALFMVITILLCISLLGSYRATWRRIGILSLTAGCGYIFFHAQSRGASLALAAGIVVLWLMQKRKLTAAILVLILLGIGSWLAPAEYWQRLATVGHYEQDTSAMDRLELWDIALKLISQHPLLGVGPDNFVLYAPNTPHNAYLQVGSEMGLPAMLVYILILTAGLRSALRARRLSAPGAYYRPFLYAVSQGVFLSILAIVVQGFTTGLAHREFVYVFVTLGFCLQRLVEQAAAEPRPSFSTEADHPIEHAAKLIPGGELPASSAIA